MIKKYKYFLQINADCMEALFWLRRNCLAVKGFCVGFNHEIAVRAADMLSEWGVIKFGVGNFPWLEFYGHPVKASIIRPSLWL